jgi:hypothetical protein
MPSVQAKTIGGHQLRRFARIEFRNSIILASWLIDSNSPAEMDSPVSTALC